MSLIYCPECGHEISQAAVACPNCGRPINAAPVVEKRVVVAERPREDGGFPPWAFIPIAVLGIVLLFILFYAMSRNDETANSNLNVNVSSQRSSSRASDNVRTTDSQTINVPSGDTTVTAPPPPESQTVTVPGSQTTVPSDRGTVVIDAKAVGSTGQPQAVRNEKFYLLDEDLETILSDADLEPIEGQSLSNSFGLSVVYPDRFGDFNRKALAAIKQHIKYSGTTDGSGKAQLGGIEPNSYYLFGITKTGKGFALWSNPVTIRTGENLLNLSPARITEMDNTSE
ncbi:MAG: zinc-ribbon domain-containing protein [Saprospiraceae bacterium]|nr:zinc-ribbon domain-containing protein [Pyrinomonadaceae bacterium]